jgi:hypothetical protein
MVMLLSLNVYFGSAKPRGVGDLCGKECVVNYGTMMILNFLFFLRGSS